MHPAPPPISHPLRVCSLFSGIGGFERGLEAVGHSTVLMCEADPFARAVLEAHFPEVEIAPDIKAMASLPECDLLTAGWPCQDLSLAGGTMGLNGTRSGLVSEIFRLIRASIYKPKYILLENVAFALDLHKGRAVSFVTKQLELLGYRWAYRILDTQAFGLPQRRRRLYVMAALDADPSAILFDGIDAPPPAISIDPALIGFYWTEGTRGLGWSPEAVPPLKGGSSIGIPSPPAIWDRATGDFLAPGIEDAERLQGFPVGWTAAASAFPRGERRRWVLVGNAVSVPIAEWIGRRLGKPECRETFLSNPTPHLRPGLPRAASGGPNELARAYSVGREGPTANARMTLTEFGLRAPSRLSRRAIDGFTRRFEVARLRKNEEFLKDLKEWNLVTT